MKKSAFSNAILIVLIGIMSACTDKQSSAQLLPDDAAFVMSIDVPSIIQAADIANDESLMNECKRLVRTSDMKRKTEKKVLSLIEDPRSAGIDLREPFFISLIDLKRIQFAFTGSISNKEDFEEFLNLLTDEDDTLEEPHLVDKESDIMYLMLGYNALLMYNNRSFIITNNARGYDKDDFIEEVAELFNLKNNFTGTKGYANLMKEDGQLKFLTSTEAYMETKEFDQAFRLIPIDIKRYLETLEESYTIMTLNMKKGEIDYTTQFYPNSEEAEELIKDLAAISGEINGKHLDYVDKNSLFTIAVNCNGKKYKEFLSSILGDIAQRHEVNMFLSALESIDGDITFNVDGDFIDEEVPNMDILCSISDKKPINDIISLFEGALEKTSDNSWKYSLTKNQRVKTGQQTYNSYWDKWEPEYEWRKTEIAQLNLGYKDNNAYVILNKSKQEPVKVNNPMSTKGIKGNNAYARVNFKKLLDIEVLQPLFNNDKDGQTARQVIENLDYMVITANSKDMKSEMRCVMSNKECNPLHTLIEVLKKEF